MARSPSEEPEGLVYRPELLSAEEEERLLDRLDSLTEGSTIGWHRDAPAFETVVGVSLGGSSRLRFQRLSGEARRSRDSIPPTKELRYSITFRTLRSRKAA